MVFKKFWEWYERNYSINLGLAAGLFLLQIFHLLWLLVEVIWSKLFGAPLLHVHGGPKILLILVDYTEIPALISISLVYINELRKQFNWKSVMYLIFLNTQWLHIFWITDEFVVDAFNTGHQLLLPAWLAWIAILIDYLEVPVIIDTLKRFVASLKKKDLAMAFEELKEN